MKIARFAYIRSLAFLVAGLLIGGGIALAAQPHMAAAKSDLIAAQYQLLSATHDKGGHRVQALSLVRQAIQQVNAGMAAGAM